MKHFDRTKPFIGFHTRFGDHDSVEGLIKLIQKGLAPKGINTLILEFNPGYAFACFPQYSIGTVTAEDCKRICTACEQVGITAVPLFQCLSHQSDMSKGADPWPLLMEHPEFCERPDAKGALTWPDFYVHSWCASNMDIYQYIFPMMDELLEVFDVDVMHIGMDEVFDIGEDCCPRCKGKDKATLFADTVKHIHDHLAEKGVQTMMWGDRLLNAQKLGYQMWEADRFGTYPAFEMENKVTRDIIITDWHYDLHDHGYPSVSQFIKAGFDTIACFGSEEEQAEHFWKFACEEIYLSQKYGYKGRVMGMLFTHWSPLTNELAEKILAGIEGCDEGPLYSSENVGRTIARVSQKKNMIR